MTRDAAREDGWRSAVRVFRRAALRLDDPLPDMPAASASAELGALMTPELPLVDFSPFVSLAEVSSTKPGGENTASSGPARLAAAPPGPLSVVGRGVRTTEVGTPEQVAPETGVVFSFKRRAAPGATSSRPGAGARATDEGSGAWPIPTWRHAEAATESLAEAGRRAAEAAAGVGRLLDHLASEVRRAERATGTPTVGRQPPPRGLADGVNAPTVAERLDKGTPSAAQDQARPGEAVGPTVTTDASAAATGATLLASLLDSLAKRPTPPSSPPMTATPSSTPDVAARLASSLPLPDTSLPTPVERAAEEPSQLWPGRTPRQPVWTAEMAARRAVDAETMVALVAEALLEQARRHGVDVT